LNLRQRAQEYTCHAGDLDGDRLLRSRLDDFSELRIAGHLVEVLNKVPGASNVSANYYVGVRSTVTSSTGPRVGLRSVNKLLFIPWRPIMSDVLLVISPTTCKGKCETDIAWR
jgi:hypothetical protein